MIASPDILKASILIVDDLAANVAVLEQMLHGAGYTAVASTRDPHAVCALHQKNHYDLILLDLQMPGMDGFEVMEALKEIEPGRPLPVLVITAQPAHKLRALKTGARDFISKPFELGEVLMRVHNMLEVRLLHRSETLLNLVRLENSQRIAGVGDWEHNFTTQRLVWSEEIYRITGIAPGTPPDSALFYRLVHPDDLAFVHREKKAAAVGLWRAEFEHRIIRPDGQVRHLHQIAEMIFDGVGQPLREVGTLQDITARKLAEETLRQSDERFREKTALLEAQIHSSLDGLLIVDPTGKRILQNDRYISMMQIPRAIVEAKDDVQSRAFVIGQMRQPEAVLEKVLDLYAHPDKTSWDEIELKNGTVFDRYSSPIIGAAGRNYGRIWAFRDVTAHKAAGRALRESEERFKFVARAVSSGIWDWNPVTDTVWWNEGFLTTFGFTAADITPGSEFWMSRIHADDRAAVRESLRGAIDGAAESWTGEYRFQRQDGSHAFVQDHGYILRDTAGKAVRMVGGMRDVSERKRLDEHFLQAQKMEALGQFSGGVAHDFNNILATISGYTELSRMVLQGNPEVQEHLAAVLHASGRAADLVRQILTFSRQQPQVRQALNLRPIVEESLKLLRATLPATVELETAIASDTPTVLANANQLHQIMMNLGINASHAMKDHPGRLRVTLEKCWVDPAHAATQPRLRPGFYARISVSDTGAGMEHATLRRIFEPFFTTKPVGEGTGLGLAVVHGIMDTHDGAVTVYSQPNEGTVFHLYFPAHAGEVLTIDEAEVPTPRGHGERILVVDDEKILASLQQKTLIALGYNAECTTLPAEACARVLAEPGHFALVLTDQTMPGMTGLALAAEVRKIQPGLPVILMTGYGLTLTPERTAAAGIHRLLLKPIGIHALGLAVHTALTAQPSLTDSHGSNSPHR